MRIKKLFFSALVVNTALSTLEAFVLTEAEMDRITSFFCGRSRALMMGKACKKDDQHIESLKNSEVLRKVGVLPAHLELRVRRLKWLQSLVLKPSNAGCLLGAWFGEYQWDLKKSENPWTRQLMCDLQDTSKMNQANSSLLEKIIENPLCIFKGDVRTWFLELDFTELRSRCLHELQLSGVYCKYRGNGDDAPSHIIRCDIFIDGKQCDYVCSCKAELVHHQVKSSLPGHTLRSEINRLVITNQCPFCSTIFADVMTTQHHLRGSYIRGYCRADLSYKTVCPKQPLSLKCPWSQILDQHAEPACDYEADHLKQLHLHVTKHVDWSPDIHFMYYESCTSTCTRSVSLVDNSQRRRNYNSTDRTYSDRALNSKSRSVRSSCSSLASNGNEPDRSKRRARDISHQTSSSGGNSSQATRATALDSIPAKRSNDQAIDRCSVLDSNDPNFDGQRCISSDQSICIEGQGVQEPQNGFSSYSTVANTCKDSSQHVQSGEEFGRACGSSREVSQSVPGCRSRKWASIRGTSKDQANSRRFEVDSPVFALNNVGTFRSLASRQSHPHNSVVSQVRNQAWDRPTLRSREEDTASSRSTTSRTEYHQELVSMSRGVSSFCRHPWICKSSCECQRIHDSMISEDECVASSSPNRLHRTNPSDLSAKHVSNQGTQNVEQKKINLAWVQGSSRFQGYVQKALSHEHRQGEKVSTENAPDNSSMDSYEWIQSTLDTQVQIQGNAKSNMIRSRKKHLIVLRISWLPTRFLIRMLLRVVGSSAFSKRRRRKRNRDGFDFFFVQMNIPVILC